MLAAHYLASSVPMAYPTQVYTLGPCWRQPTYALCPASSPPLGGGSCFAMYALMIIAQALPCWLKPFMLHSVPITQIPARLATQLHSVPIAEPKCRCSDAFAKPHPC